MEQGTGVDKHIYTLIYTLDKILCVSSFCNKIVRFMRKIVMFPKLKTFFMGHKPFLNRWMIVVNV